MIPHIININFPSFKTIGYELFKITKKKFEKMNNMIMTKNIFLISLGCDREYSKKAKRTVEYFKKIEIENDDKYNILYWSKFFSNITSDDINYNKTKCRKNIISSLNKFRHFGIRLADIHDKLKGITIIGINYKNHKIIYEYYDYNYSDFESFANRQVENNFESRDSVHNDRYTNISMMPNLTKKIKSESSDGRQNIYNMIDCSHSLWKNLRFEKILNI